MPSLSITEMRAQLRYGGARPTLFSVSLTNPVTNVADEKSTFMMQATSLPAFTLGNIRVPYMGRFINVPGDREFAPWSVQVLNDEDFLVRNALETWQNKINTLEGNIRDLPSSEAIHYTANAKVTQLSKNGSALRTYTFKNVWPIEIGDIQLAWGDTDQIEVFPVTFMFDTYGVSGATGDAGGE